MGLATDTGEADARCGGQSRVDLLLMVPMLAVLA